jgi:4'-phosphopantetheinyl transferase
MMTGASDVRMAISSQDIDVWLVFYHEIVAPRLFANLRELLTDAELRREVRFHFDDDRKRYLVTRAMARIILSRYAAIAPIDWEFSENQYGRPEIVNRDRGAAGLSFNISHVRGLIALGIARNRKLGIDVENIAARHPPASIACQFFSPSEAAELAALPRERQCDRFFEYWTFKESYVKARGMGLSLPLDRFSFFFPNERTVRIRFESGLSDDGCRWSFRQYRPTREHVLALCAECPTGVPPLVTVRKTIPMVSEEVLDLETLKTSDFDSGAA